MFTPHKHLQWPYLCSTDPYQLELQGAAGEGLNQQQLLDLLNTHGLGGLGGAGGFSPLEALR